MIDLGVPTSRILVVEDEYMLATEMSSELSAAGAVVIGPVPTVEQATALIQESGAIDGAILDVNLGGELVYPVADLLARSGIPFVFVTGYETSALPQEYAAVPCIMKPVNMAEAIRALGRAGAL